MLKQRLQQDLKNAMKQKNELEVSVLRMVLASLLNKQKQKRYKLVQEQLELEQEALEKQSQLSDEEIIEALFSENKKRKDAIIEFERGERPDLVEKEKAELEILKKYLPEQLSEQEIRKIVKEAIEQVGAENIKDMGKVMANSMPKLKGKADGAVVSKIVKELLIRS